MTTYRQHLPQLEGNLFLTDGGIERVQSRYSQPE